MRAAFTAQPAMTLIGASIDELRPGFIAIGVRCHHELMSHDGTMPHYPSVVQGGTIGQLTDSAMGFAVLTLLPDGAGVFTVEYKINFLRPAVGERLIARATVIRPGTNLTVATADVVVVNAGHEKGVATALGTFHH